VVSLDRICSAYLVVSVSGLVRIAHLEGPGLEGLHHIVHFRVDCIVSFSNRNFLGGLCWCRGFFARDCREVYHYWHLWEQNSSWDRIRSDSWCRTGSVKVKQGEGVGGHPVVEDVLSEFVVFERRGVSGI